MNNRYQNFLEEKRLFDAEAERIFNTYFGNEYAKRITYDEKEVTVYYDWCARGYCDEYDETFPVEFLFKPKEELDILVYNLKTEREKEKKRREEESKLKKEKETEERELAEYKKYQEKYGKI